MCYMIEWLKGSDVFWKNDLCVNELYFFNWFFKLTFVSKQDMFSSNLLEMSGCEFAAKSIN